MSTVRDMRVGILLLAWVAGLCAQSGSVEGTTLDAVTREPLGGVHVRLIGANFNGLTATYGAMSDRAGHFSIALIRPGTYILYPERNGYLHVQPKGGTEIPRIAVKAGEKIAGYQLEMTQRAVISGRVVDEAGDPVQGARMATVAVTPGAIPINFTPPAMIFSDDHGEFRLLGPPGKYYVEASPPSQNQFGNERPEKRSDGSNAGAYVATFFPSALRKDRATPVEAVAGKDVTGIEIRLGRGQQGVTVSGSVSGAPAGNNRGSVILQYGEAADRFTNSRSGPIGADGRYKFEGLSAAYYRVWAMYNDGGKTSLVSWAKEGPLEGDVVNADLTLSAGAEFTGTVKLEGEAPGAVKRKVRLESVGSVIYMATSMIGGDVDGAGNFSIRGIAPGKYRVKVSPLPENGYVKSLEVDGTAAPNLVADLTKAVGAAAKIALGADGGQINGRVVDGAGTNPPSGLVMVFLGLSAEEFQLNNDTERATPDGKFTLRGIAPGKYRLLVVDVFQLSGATSAEKLKKAFAWGEEVEVKAGARIAKEFKVTPLEDPNAKK